MGWVDTPSETFVARHDVRDTADAQRVLTQLELARTRLEQRFQADVGELEVVLHSSLAQLDAAQPWVPLARRLTAPAARRYVVGWAGQREIHVLCPRLLAHRASNVEGSLEMLMLAPAALLSRRYVAASHPKLPPPATPGRIARWSRWAWLVEGAAQWLSGQTRHVRPAVARRLREGPKPDVPALAHRRDAARRHDLRPARAGGGRPRLRHARPGPAPGRADPRAGSGLPALPAPHRGGVALSPGPAR